MQSMNISLPEIGAPLTLRRPELARLRKWHVKGFERFLIFYLPRKAACGSCACSTQRGTGGACLELTHKWKVAGRGKSNCAT